MTGSTYLQTNFIWRIDYSEELRQMRIWRDGSNSNAVLIKATGDDQAKLTLLKGLLEEIISGKSQFVCVPNALDVTK